MAIEVGQEAPDFTLKDQQGNEVTLSKFRGNDNVVIVFYPFTFTGVCEGELCSLRDDNSDFQAKNAQLLAISCDSRHSQAMWAKQQGFDFPVLSDFWPHGEVARAYGVFNEALGCANRATFVIDKDGKVVDTFASPDLGTPRDKAAYEAALARLS
ncbi:MAG: Peroxiredoxin [Actinomycetia bacterium]|jgi:peroxiredoxin|nr:Peroxiredoxin [Actinomycetes bacterium]